MRSTFCTVLFDSRRSRRIPTILFLCSLVLTGTGCSLFDSDGVKRRITIKTNPPGAAAYFDNQYIGTTPTATAVTYYGTREIQVVRDGYRTEKILRTFNPPWYQLPPLDFVTDTLWPREIRDERIVDITMVPQQVISSEELQARARGLRIQAAQGVATPVPPTIAPDGFGNGIAQPIDPTFQTNPGAIVTDPNSVQPGQPTWQPGQLLRDFVMPGGNPPTRIPEAGILPGGGYRPPLDNPQ
jgi:PEGA domain